MYKDAEKQRKAQRDWIAQKRAKVKMGKHEDSSGCNKSVEPISKHPVEPILSNPTNVEPVEPTVIPKQVDELVLPRSLAGQLDAVVNPKPAEPVTQAELEALPKDVIDNINHLCDTQPEIYPDRKQRFIRAALYQRKFPNPPTYPDPGVVMTGTMTDFEKEHYKPADQLASNEVNRVSLPCDVDYIAQHIADNGGEASFKTVKGEVQDLHITQPPETPLQPTTQPQEQKV